MPEFHYQTPFPLPPDETEYELLSSEWVRVERFGDDEVLRVDPQALVHLAKTAFRNCSFMLREKHLRQVAAILDDPEASKNDRYVALTMLRNAEVAAEGILPFCQDTGTATIIGKKGSASGPESTTPRPCRKGCSRPTPRRTCATRRTLALTMYEEQNTKARICPAQIDLYR